MPQADDRGRMFGLAARAGQAKCPLRKAFLSLSGASFPAHFKNLLLFGPNRGLAT